MDEIPSIQAILIYRNAKADGRPISMDEAIACSDAKIRRCAEERQAEFKALDIEIQAVKSGRLPHGKEN